jgi:hypothetical protein
MIMFLQNDNSQTFSRNHSRVESFKCCWYLFFPHIYMLLACVRYVRKRLFIYTPCFYPFVPYDKKGESSYKNKQKQTIVGWFCYLYSALNFD